MSDASVGVLMVSSDISLGMRSEESGVVVSNNFPRYFTTPENRDGTASVESWNVAYQCDVSNMVKLILCSVQSDHSRKPMMNNDEESKHLWITRYVLTS